MTKKTVYECSCEEEFQDEAIAYRHAKDCLASRLALILGHLTREHDLFLKDAFFRFLNEHLLTRFDVIDDLISVLTTVHEGEHGGEEEERT